MSHELTRRLWDSARDSAYRNGFGPEFDQLCTEGEETLRALRSTTGDAAKTDMLEHLTYIARRRADLAA